MLPGFLNTMWVLLRWLGILLRLPAPSPRENIEKANIVHQNFDRLLHSTKNYDQLIILIKNSNIIISNLRN